MQPIAVMFKGSGFHVNDYAASTKEPSKVEKPEDAPIPASADAVEKSKPLEAVGEAPAAAPPSTSAPAPSTGNSESTT